MSGKGKPDLSINLGPLGARMAEVVKVGDEKHGPGSWRSLDSGQFLEAASRHLSALRQGEDTDPESGESHWAHVAVNALYAFHVKQHEEEQPLDALLRLQDVRRWHIVRVAGREQSVAEHSFNVAVLGRRYLQVIGRPDLVGEYLGRALLHDWDEALFGDVPSPAKPGSTKPEDRLGRLLKMMDRLDAWLFIRQHGSGDYAKLAERQLAQQVDSWAKADPAFSQVSGEALRVTTAKNHQQEKKDD